MGQGDIINGYDLFESQIAEVLVKYPKLRKEHSGGQAILAGELDVIDRDGKYWATYQVEIHSNNKFPNRFPILFETGGQIPRIGDWHIYEDTGACCVDVEPEEILTCIEGITLESYITKQALPYLFNQTYRKIEGYYVNGEYGHGVFGKIEYYSLIFKIDNLLQLAKCLFFIAEQPKPDRTSLCFCGSGVKYRYCHREAYQKLHPLGRNFLINEASHIYNLATRH